MKKQEVKNLLFDMLAKILTGTDFRPKKTEDRFFQKTETGWQDIGLALWDYNPEFEFSLNICIRLDEVEQIFNMFSGVAPRHQLTTPTTITRLEQFPGGSSRYRVVTAADVTSATGILAAIIRNSIIPFFDRHRDVHALDLAVNGQQPGIDITQNPAKAMHSVILACLAENENFDRIVAKHRTDMRITKEATHPFNNLVEYLKSRSERQKGSGVVLE